MPLYERPPLETLAPAKDRWAPIDLEHSRLEVECASLQPEDLVEGGFPFERLESVVIVHPGVPVAARRLQGACQIIRTSCVLSFVAVTLSQPTGAVAAQAPSPPGPRPSLSATAGGPYATGLLSEEADNDLAAAAAAYREAIQEFDRQREGAANAIFRLGEVYRKMGRMEEAKVQYARVLREFPDMVQLTELSHSYLLGESLRPTRRSTGDGSAASRPAAVQPRVAPVSPPIMSTHERRAPIAAVRLMAEELVDHTPADPAKAREYHGYILQECRRLRFFVEPSRHAGRRQ